MSEPIFVPGLFFNDPHANAPEWVKGSISIKPKEFVDFLRANYDPSGEYIRFTMKVSKGGKMYFELDTWKKEQASAAPVNRPNENIYQAPEDSTPPPPTEEEIQIQNIPF